MIVSLASSFFKHWMHRTVQANILLPLGMMLLWLITLMARLLLPAFWRMLFMGFWHVRLPLSVWTPPVP